MQRTFAAAMLAATLGMGGGAFAADVYSSGGMKDAPFAIAETSWTGFHVGLGLGGAAVNHDIIADSVELNGVGGTGIFGTVELGYDRQFGRIVAGIFFNYDFANLSSDLKSGGVESAKLNDMWSAGGRIGYLVNPDTLAYFLAAYTQASFDMPASYRSITPDGYSLGGGLETKLGGNWSLKGEYRFTVLNTDTLSSSCPRVTDQADIQTGRLVLSYKADIFGRDYTPLK
ncbi:MAG: outer membrane beta-barrel protein [Rhodomicrobium sp.]